MLKPFYIYQVTGKLNDDQPIKINPQTSLVEGIAREPRTHIEKYKDRFIKEYSLMRVNHDVEEKQYGITTAVFNGQPKTIDFENYLKPEEFDAYLNNSKSIIVLQASKATTRSAAKAINDDTQNFQFKKNEFRFEIAHSLVEEYKGAWFQNINANISSIGMRGQDVQDDDYFGIYRQQGDLSNITINFEYGHRKHEIMITKESGVILFNSYPNKEVEIDIVSNVFDQVIKKVWKKDPSINY